MSDAGGNGGASAQQIRSELTPRAELTAAKRRILERLKRVESATAPELAVAFGLTDTAIRQHLEALEVSGLVERATSSPSGRGRPPVAWHLADLADVVFPDRHADLTVELLGALRARLGDGALDAVLDARATTQLATYRAVVNHGRAASIHVRAERLARRRSDEGYLAEAVAEPDGSVLLIEHHCPVADAARACGGLCRTELEVFQAAFGDDVLVERTQHLMAGDHRCAYRITARRAVHHAVRNA